MAEEHINQTFRLKTKEEIKNYFIKEIDQNELMINKHKKVCITLNNNEYFLILASIATGCASMATGCVANKR